ncbi:GNAT family N-acetyltransferase [Pyxidicoccus xibeiensis]|uniref:GNAT family N-acetyltransferase n=1 Tax=Pyxidicoccus xibeiensis TaxID=2906759 RepID=UPI0020A83700|nr:GNAT family protein [Pyxidicoccus xibeiensis]MCP3137751.1 GNAT family N-acetyltransferase [Pyxidicoccus xibeiensis]
MSTRFFDTYPELVTDKFRLRQPTLEDVEPLAAIYFQSVFGRYIIGDPPGGVAKMHEKVARDLEAMKRGEVFRWVLCERGQEVPLGNLGLFNWNQHNRSAEIGYVISMSLWGQGVMKELMSAVLRFGFEDIGLHRVEAHVDPSNGASLRVLTRAGFQQEGVLRESFAVTGGYRDTVVLGMLEQDWQR